MKVCSLRRRPQDDISKKKGPLSPGCIIQKERGRQNIQRKKKKERTEIILCWEKYNVLAPKERGFWPSKEGIRTKTELREGECFK